MLGGKGSLAQMARAFDPEVVAIINSAFSAVIADLGLSDRDDAVALRVARRIIELAFAGERDPERLNHHEPCRQGIEVNLRARGALGAEASRMGPSRQSKPTPPCQHPFICRASPARAPVAAGPPQGRPGPEAGGRGC
jgi:hypothetical protein